MMLPMRRLILAFIAAFSALQAQPAGDQTSRWFPQATRPAPEASPDMRNEFRALRAGSGTDRLKRRRTLIRSGSGIEDALRQWLASGNHLKQVQSCLILMERRDSGAFPVLERLAAGKLRGERGFAALTLGRYADPDAEKALLSLAREGRNEDVIKAVVALGRVRGPLAVKFLPRFLARASSQPQKVAALLAMGLHGDPAFLPSVRQYLGSGKERLRRAATAALGGLPLESVTPDLMARARDQDPEVRQIAFEGLALAGPEAQRFEALLKIKFTGRGAEVRRHLLAVAAAGGSRAVPWLRERGRNRRSEELQTAVVAALGRAGGREGLGGAASVGLGDPSGEVRRMALLVSAWLGPLTGHVPHEILGYCEDGDDAVARVAVLAHVYLGGGPERRKELLKALPRMKTGGAAHALAQALWTRMEDDEAATRRYAGALLQVELDDLEGAASWNRLDSINRLLLSVLDLENALPRGGGGAAPGGGGTAANRRRAAAINRPAPRDEDLRRHLDHWPFADQRPYREFRVLR